MKGLTAKHFTTDETKALANFHKSPAGLSVIHKFGKYTADNLTIIEEEILKAIKKLKTVRVSQSL